VRGQAKAVQQPVPHWLRSGCDRAAALDWLATPGKFYNPDGDDFFGFVVAIQFEQPAHIIQRPSTWP